MGNSEKQPWRDAPPASSKVVRSVMRAIRRRDTEPETALRRALRRNGVRGYRIHRRTLPGRPDIVFSRKRVVIFVMGCFWHCCPKCKPSPPKTNTMWWKNKFRLTKQRDRKNRRLLESTGWHYVMFWECEIAKNVQQCVDVIAAILERS